MDKKTTIDGVPAHATNRKKKNKKTVGTVSSIPTITEQTMVRCSFRPLVAVHAGQPLCRDDGEGGVNLFSNAEFLYKYQFHYVRN